jgi:hypothetical protein
MKNNESRKSDDQLETPNPPGIRPDAHPPSMFRRREHVPHTESWDDGDRGALDATLGIAFGKLTATQREQILQLTADEDVERFSLRALEEIVQDRKTSNRIAEVIRDITELGVDCDFLDRFRLGITPATHHNGVALARALHWRANETNRDDFRILYPASGGDGAGWLNYLDPGLVDHIIPVDPNPLVIQAKSIGGLSEHDNMTIPSKGVFGMLKGAIDENRMPTQPSDVMVLDGWGVNAVKEITPDQFQQLLAEDGMVITHRGYAKDLEALDFFPPEKFAIAGYHDSLVVIERIPTAVDSRAKEVINES